jgi:hypothetical protein
VAEIDEELAAWRRTVDSKFVSIDGKLLHLEGGHVRITDGLIENTRITKETKESVDTLVVSLGPLAEFINEGRSTGVFTKKLYLLLKWIIWAFVVPITILYIVIYGFMHHGTAPEWAKTIWQIWKNVGQ